MKQRGDQTEYKTLDLGKNRKDTTAKNFGYLLNEEVISLAIDSFLSSQSHSDLVIKVGDTLSLNPSKRTKFWSFYQNEIIPIIASSLCCKFSNIFFSLQVSSSDLTSEIRVEY